MYAAWTGVESATGAKEFLAPAMLDSDLPFFSSQKSILKLSVQSLVLLFILCLFFPPEVFSRRFL